MFRSYLIYDEDPGYAPLMFSEAFVSSQDFVDKIISIAGSSTDLDILYRILANKYAYSTTRYTMEEAFVLAIKRELEITWPVYLKQKSIMSTIYSLTTDELMTKMETLRNTIAAGEIAGTDGNTQTNDLEMSGTITDAGDTLQNIVNANNSPVTNAATIAIANKSNVQTAGKNSSTNTTLNKNTGTVLNASTTAQTSSGTNEETMKMLTNKLDAVISQYEASSRDYLEQIYRKTDALFRVILT